MIGRRSSLACLSRQLLHKQWSCLWYYENILKQHTIAYRCLHGKLVVARKYRVFLKLETFCCHNSTLSGSKLRRQDVWLLWSTLLWEKLLWKPKGWQQLSWFEFCMLNSCTTGKHYSKGIHCNSHKKKTKKPKQLAIPSFWLILFRTNWELSLERKL